MPFPFLRARSADGLDMLSEDALSDVAAHPEIVSRAVAALAAMPLRPRRRAVASLDHLSLASVLRAEAVPLFRSIVDDEAIQLALREDVVLAWISVDAAGCASHVLATFDDWQLTTVLRVLASLEASEAFEVLAPRIVSDAATRRRIAHAGREVSAAFADPRWLDVALRLLPRDAMAACHLLRLNASKRGDEELCAIVERATAVDDTAVAALDALWARAAKSVAREKARNLLLDVLAALLAGPAGENVERTAVRFMVQALAEDLRQRARARRSVVALGRIDACGAR